MSDNNNSNLSVEDVLELSDKVNEQINTIEQLLGESVIMKRHEYEKLKELLEEQKNIKKDLKERDKDMLTLGVKIDQLKQKIRDCEEKNGKLYGKNADLTRQLADKDDEILELNEKIKRLTEELAALTAERDDLLANLKQCEEEKVQNNTDLLERNRRLREELGKKNAEIETLKQKLATCENEKAKLLEQKDANILALNEVIRRLTGELANLKKEKDDLVIKLRQCEEEKTQNNDKLLLQIEQLRAALEEKDADIKKLEQNLKEQFGRLNGQIDGLTKEIKELKKQLAECEATKNNNTNEEITRLRQELVKKEQELAEIIRLHQERVEELKIQIEDLQGQLLLKTIENAELQEQIKTLQQQITTLQEQLITQKGESDGTIGDLNDQLATCNTELERLQKLNSEKEAEIQQLTAALKECNESKRELEKKNDELNKKNTELQQQLEAKNEEIKGLQQQITELTAANKRLQKALADLQTNLTNNTGTTTELNKQLQANETELQRLQALIGQKDAEIQKLNAALEECQKTKTSQKEEIERLEQKIKELTEESRVKTDENNVLLRQIEDLNNTNTNLRQQLQERDGKNADLTKELAELQGLNKTNAAEIQRLKEKLTDCEKLKEELKTCRDNNDALTTNNAALTANNNELKQKVDKLNEELEALRKQNGELEVELAKLNSLLKNLKNMLKNGLGNTSLDPDDPGYLEAIIEELLKELGKLSAVNTNLTKQMKELTDNIADLNNQPQNNQPVTVHKLGDTLKKAIKDKIKLIKENTRFKEDDDIKGRFNLKVKTDDLKKNYDNIIKDTDNNLVITKENENDYVYLLNALDDILEDGLQSVRMIVCSRPPPRQPGGVIYKPNANYEYNIVSHDFTAKNIETYSNKLTQTPLSQEEYEFTPENSKENYKNKTNTNLIFDNIKEFYSRERIPKKKFTDKCDKSDKSDTSGSGIITDNTKMDDVECGDTFKDIITYLKTGRVVFLKGYGYSGSGKTHVLIGNTADDNYKEGFVVQILNSIKKEDVNNTTDIKLTHIYECYSGFDITNLLKKGSKPPVYNPESLTFDDNPWYCRGEKIILFGPNYASNNTNLNKLIVKFNDNIHESFNENLNKIITETEGIRRKERRIVSTPFNPNSSRSHLILRFEIIFKNTNTNTEIKSSFVVMDLAGSENTLDIIARSFNKFRKKEYVSIKESVAKPDPLLQKKIGLKSFNNNENRDIFGFIGTTIINEIKSVRMDLKTKKANAYVNMVRYELFNKLLLRLDSGELNAYKINNKANLGSELDNINNLIDDLCLLITQGYGYITPSLHVLKQFLLVQMYKSKRRREKGNKDELNEELQKAKGYFGNVVAKRLQILEIIKEFIDLQHDNSYDNLYDLKDDTDNAPKFILFTCLNSQQNLIYDLENSFPLHKFYTSNLYDNTYTYSCTQNINAIENIIYDNRIDNNKIGKGEGTVDGGIENNNNNNNNVLILIYIILLVLVIILILIILILFIKCYSYMNPYKKY